MTALEALKEYQDHAGVTYPQTQHQADKAWRILKPHLLDQERLELSVARGHVTDTREGRRELDSVCAKVRARLEAIR